MRPRITILLVLLAASFAAVATIPALGEDPKTRDPLVIERPKTVDDETWKRLKEGYQDEKDEFVQLLVQLEKSRIEYGRDGLADILKKQVAVDALLDEHRTGVLAHRIEPELVVLDYTAFLRETAPRLSGRILTVGPQSVYQDVGVALASSEPGDVIRLDEGTYAVRAHNTPLAKLADVAIVGCGADKTTLSISLGECQRVRLQGLRIDCRDEPFIPDGGRDTRTDSIVVESCTVMGYNSANSGSAITGTHLVLLLDGCTFEGMSGRSNGNAQGGTPFDLRGANLLYARKTLFKDNNTILRASFPCVFERCKATNSTQVDAGIQLSPGPAFFRKSELKTDTPAKEFDHATDDPEVVAFLLGEKKLLDPLTKRILSELKLDRSIPYWVALLRSRTEAVRLKAARRVEVLTGKKVGIAEVTTKVAVDDLAKAVEELGSADVAVRDKAIETLGVAGESARALLEEAAENGTARVSKRARQVLATLGNALPDGCEDEYARLMSWFEENRSELVFDEKTGRWGKAP
jgi:hypothetical protein